MERVRKGAGFGLFLLLAGIIWILAEVGILTWSILDSLYVLWPLILVIIGVGIIFRRNPIVKAAAWIVFLAVLIGYSYFVVGRGTDNRNLVSGSDVTIEGQTQTKTADLKISFGGTRIIMDYNVANNANLLEASLRDKSIVHSSNFSSDGSKASIIFDKTKGSYINLRFDNNFKNTFHLNNAVIWNLDIDTGATDANLDLSGLKVDKLSLDVGAANTKLIMGRYNSSLTIKAGVSNIKIEIPQDTGIKVKLDGGLNNTNIDESGWVKRDGSSYSPGYDTKMYKIDANIEMGIGQLTVNNLQ